MTLFQDEAIAFEGTDVGMSATVNLVRSSIKLFVGDYQQLCHSTVKANVSTILGTHVVVFI